MMGAINLIMNNLGVSLEVFVVSCLFLMGLIFYAVDFKLGAVMHFIFYALNFIWFYFWSESNTTINWWLPLTLMFVFLIVLCFSLFPASNTQVTRGLV